jgi:hypothetical protein
MNDIWTGSPHLATLLGFTGLAALIVTTVVCVALHFFRRTANPPQKKRISKPPHGRKLAALHSSVREINADRERALALIASMGG